MWNLVSVRLETVLVSVQDRCMVCTLWYHRLRNIFGRPPMVLLGHEAQVEPYFGPFGDIANPDAR